ACTLPGLSTTENTMSQNIVRHEPGAILSRAVEYNGMVFVAGLTADDYSLDIKGQTEQVLRKIDKYLAAAGTNKSRLLSTLIYISDINNKDKMNEAWQAWIGKDVPARACVQAVLGTSKTLVEIMVTAAK
ncbi:MAG: RidA family protein, partial [Burkholderiales bacterium]